MAEIFPDIRVEPGDLTETAKFVVGKVALSDGNPAFLKRAKEPVQQSAAKELRNEARWLRYIGIHPLPAFRAPMLYDENAEQGALLTEWVDGRPFDESALDEPETITEFVGILGAMIGASSNDPPIYSGDWYHGRIRARGAAFDSPLLVDDTRFRLGAVLDKHKDRIATLPTGLVHGDFNLSNIMRTRDGGVPYLIDEEFGGVPNTTSEDYKSPRLHDAAHFYHTLRCQYHRPDLATIFYGEVEERVADTFKADEHDFHDEFYLSVLERTMSMMYQFITNPEANKVIKDERRLNPRPYVLLVGESLERLE